EAEVHIQRSGFHRIQREAIGGGARADRADPHGREPDLALEKFEEARGPVDRNVDVLYDRLAMPAAQAVKCTAHAPAAVPPHDPLIRARAQALAAVEAPQPRDLR